MYPSSRRDWPLKRANRNCTLSRQVASIVSLLGVILLILLLAGNSLCTISYEPCPLTAELSANLSEYEPHEICNSINLVQSSENGNFSKYSHCRVVNGFVSLRHFRISATANNSEKATFPKLEVITDFLVLYKISVQKNAVSLDSIFPNLRLVAGRRRFLNNSVYLSHLHTHNQIELNQLQEVCGPVWLQNSPSVCFRYSHLYWRLLPVKGQLAEQFRNLVMDLPLDSLLIESGQSSSFEGRLRIGFKLPEELRPIWDSYRHARFTIFDIDPTMYNYIVGQVSKTANCNENAKLQHTFTLTDLVNSDHRNTFLEGHIAHHLDTFDLLGMSNLSKHCITAPSNKFETINRNLGLVVLSKFDLRHIHHFRIPDKPNLYLGEMEKPFKFKFGHVYIIKTMACFGPSLLQCHILHFHKLIPTVDMFPLLTPKHTPGHASTFLTTSSGSGSLENSGNSTMSFSTPNSRLDFISFRNATIVFGALLGILLCFALVVRFVPSPVEIWYQVRMRHVKAGVISVNPEYTPIGSIWSCDPFSQKDTDEDNSYEIIRTRLKILENKAPLGLGEFGMVYEGLLLDRDLTIAEMSNAKMPSNAIRVAVKQLRKEARHVDKARFITEAKYMRTFKSNFLVKLIGVCSLQEPLMVVMEFMENGDLKRYLRKVYQNFQKQHDFAVMPAFDSTIRMAIQIADAGLYLHSKRIIHRDIAARNCMVTSDLTVKIGDFGLSRTIYYQADYYRISEETMIPLRWCAPESVRKSIFSPQTDVWSYGVVLWEIMCFGEQPYQGKSDLEVKEMLVGCVRLPRPVYYSPVIWDLAKRCWSKNSQSRPSFRSIIEYLHPHLNKQREQFEMLSYYNSTREQHRATFALSRIIPKQCLVFLSKFCDDHAREDMCPQEYHPGQPPVSRTPGLSKNQPAQGSCRNNNVRYAVSMPQRARCASCDSFQTSMSAFSEATTLSMISNEPSIQSRHNSAGSDKSAKSNAPESVPLI